MLPTEGAVGVKRGKKKDRCINTIISPKGHALSEKSIKGDNWEQPWGKDRTFRTNTGKGEVSMNELFWGGGEKSRRGQGGSRQNSAKWLNACKAKFSLKGKGIGCNIS